MNKFKIQNQGAPTWSITNSQKSAQFLFTLSYLIRPEFEKKTDFWFIFPVKLVTLFCTIDIQSLKTLSLPDRPTNQPTDRHTLWNRITKQWI